jgi:hypothetical protein
MISRISSILRYPRHFSIRHAGRAAAIAVGAAALVVSVGAAYSSTARPAHPDAVTFTMVRTPDVTCLPNARATVTITRGSLNDTMVINVHGLPHKTGFDLFVIQEPNKPFGLAWYQTDVATDSHGNGTATVRGVFNKETFTVSLGGTVVVPATHQYHLGLWFSNPTVPFNLGCESGATSPIITPFNGNQHAGIQILNTSNFGDPGPLHKVKG